MDFLHVNFDNSAEFRSFLQGHAASWCQPTGPCVGERRSFERQFGFNLGILARYYSGVIYIYIYTVYNYIPL